MPFGEYVPFRSVLFFVDQIVDAVGTIAPGLVPTVFQLPGGRFGVLICYEGIFPALTRRFVADGADFLVNVTNDAWYGRTSAPYQHLAQATLRAIENRVPLVRAANTGISAMVDPDGRIRWQGPLFEPLAARRRDRLARGADVLHAASATSSSGRARSPRSRPSAMVCAAMAERGTMAPDDVQLRRCGSACAGSTSVSTTLGRHL